MIVLGIETSCDETASAISEDGKILSSFISTQKIHKKYGGVVPEIASREHDKILNQMVFDTLNDSKKSISDIDGIAVTQGPGLTGTLLSGVCFAKGLSLGLNIPIIVHSRNAENDTYEILKSEKRNSDLKVLVHCFTGSKNFAKKLLDINCYISVSGIITFKNSNELTDTISSIPIKNLLVETDSPYLTPTPYRGKSNEPSYIIHTVEKLSQIQNLPKESIMKYTTNNFKDLFNLN